MEVQDVYVGGEAGPEEHAEALEGVGAEMAEFPDRGEDLARGPVDMAEAEGRGDVELLADHRHDLKGQASEAAEVEVVGLAKGLENRRADGIVLAAVHRDDGQFKVSPVVRSDAEDSVGVPAWRWARHW